MKAASSPQMKEYFGSLKCGLDAAMDVAQHARKMGLDPERFVEITPAQDVAARVEGIVGPPGIAAIIRELEVEGKSREMVAHEIVLKICRGEIIQGNPQKLIDQAVRTGVSIITEGVLVAPTEGIAEIAIKESTSERPQDGNPDGTSYLAVYYAGPIRSAGGTVAAISVVLADVARRHFGISDYRPTDTEVERYVEEINLYNDRCAHLQFKPTDDEIRHIIRSCPVCITGEPTEEAEVSVYRDLPRMETNRVRSGIALVSCEGVAQKAAKVLKYTKKIGLDWSFLERLAKGVKKGDSGAFELKPDARFMDEIVAGRPIFSYPFKPGGFRIRYGRTRATGIAGKAIHPATMWLLDAFPAIGTQLKIERPGKGTVVVPCDTILGPVVKLQDGSVVEVNSSEEAKAVAPKVSEILFLGDMLITLGDFLKSNHPLVPSGIVEEWWALLAEGKGIKPNHSLTAGEAFKLSRAHGIPLHPKYTFHWHDITSLQLAELARYLANGKLNMDWFRLKSFEIEASPQKRILECLLVPHTLNQGTITIEGEKAFALLKSLGLLQDGKLTLKIFEHTFSEGKSPLDNVCALSGVQILPKAPLYIGSRMGRPEKSREREMKPPVHTLFPVGDINKNRSILRAYDKMKNSEKREGRGIEVEISRLKCKACGKIGISITCPCGGECAYQRVCGQCGRSSTQNECQVCKGKPKTHFYERRSVDIVAAVDAAKHRLNVNGSWPDVKGVKGLISDKKVPELLDKGMLRAKHGLTIFRDTTCRLDSTDVPLTHFMPKEIGVGVERLRALGYTADYTGKPLLLDTQLCELKVQDLLISDRGAEHFMKVTSFIDDMLINIYQMRPYYNVTKREQLVGQLAVGLSPHTSAGVLCRIIGFTPAHCGFAHPYFHCAKRRNADGDEDSVMLLMDALLNFSKSFIPASRGGTMDAPLVLTTLVDPSEIDDEAHSMEVCASYPLALYELAQKFASPSEVQVALVKNALGTPAQYEGLLFTHASSRIDDGPLSSAYIALEKKMSSKIEAEFALEDKLRCVDPADVAERVLLSHFLPDTYGNLRSFSRQMFRCGECNAKYRRVPLIGKCTNPKCGGKLLLTIYKGGIEKYLVISKMLVDRYKLPTYMKQRLELIQKDINSVFVDEKAKQAGLADFM